MGECLVRQMDWISWRDDLSWGKVWSKEAGFETWRDAEYAINHEHPAGLGPMGARPETFAALGTDVDARKIFSRSDHPGRRCVV